MWLKSVWVFTKYGRITEILLKLPKKVHIVLMNVYVRLQPSNHKTTTNQNKLYPEAIILYPVNIARFLKFNSYQVYSKSVYRMFRFTCFILSSCYKGI
jgi:hypothetical protein